MMIIDSHVHAGHADKLTASWETFADIEVSLRRMDCAGIDKAVVFPIGTGDFRRANREIAEIVRQHSDRLFGYAKVSQREDAGRIAPMLKETFKDLDLRGLKLHGHPNREIMDALAPWRKPLLVDVKGDVFPLRYVAESYPDVPLIIAHMGEFRALDGPAVQMTLSLARRYPNVYFDTSSVTEHACLEEALSEGLCHKMIFGSDGPVLHCGVELARIKALDLSPEDADRVLWKNIAGLLGEPT